MKRSCSCSKIVWPGLPSEGERKMTTTSSTAAAGMQRAPKLPPKFSALFSIGPAKEAMFSSLTTVQLLLKVAGLNKECKGCDGRGRAGAARGGAVGERGPPRWSSSKEGRARRSGSSSNCRATSTLTKGADTRCRAIGGL